MNGPLFTLLVRRHRLAVGLASVVPIVLGVVVGLIYPTMSKQRQMLDTFRPFLRFLGQDQVDLFSPAGAFTLSFQHPLVLLTVAVIVGIPATGLPAGERGRGALDLLCAGPVSRRRLLATVAGVVGLAAAAIALAGLVGSGVGALLAGVAGEVPWGAIAGVAVNSAGLASCLGAGALVASVAAPDRSAAGIWFGVGVFAAFILDVTARMWRDGAWLRWFTPYGLMRPAATTAESGSPWNGVIEGGVLFVVAAILLAVALVLIERRKSA